MLSAFDVIRMNPSEATKGQYNTKALKEILDGMEIKYTPKWEICNSCDGNGTELRGALKGADVTELLQEDPEFAEDYFGGNCDTQCSECNGSGKVTTCEVDWDNFTSEQKDSFANQWVEHVEYQQELAFEASMRSQGREW